jgi:hypothetical protein
VIFLRLSASFYDRLQAEKSRKFQKLDRGLFMKKEAELQMQMCLGTLDAHLNSNFANTCVQFTVDLPAILVAS